MFWFVFAILLPPPNKNKYDKLTAPARAPQKPLLWACLQNQFDAHQIGCVIQLKICLLYSAFWFLLLAARQSVPLPSWDVTYKDRRKFVQKQRMRIPTYSWAPKVFLPKKLVTDLLEDALKKALQSEGAPFHTFQPPLVYRSWKLLAHRSDAAEAHSCSAFPPTFSNMCWFSNHITLLFFTRLMFTNEQENSPRICMYTPKLPPHSVSALLGELTAPHSSNWQIVQRSSCLEACSFA